MAHRSATTGRPHNASITGANGAAYGVGVLTTILATGPTYSALSAPFIDYVVGYYGQSFSGIAAAFLFILLVALIFMITVATAHTLIEAFRAKIHFFLTRIKRRF